ncbi:pimeloyl-ACP methyl ester carboxylesterase [Nocardiopsis sp. Huas11]|uniref:alpha/beta fold hydrolase n=1 Tax=Nocardiopsis sp. Huas11 TaxID=2183912 RepID=UPI000EB1E8B8|nr:alpha/beta hydrolase [Nocardiopsis sp. Huas11]RKS09178.1 pimeloyl-ACP methyl ester carboxylesterase [Nocardiopsis sp. Huas11]
MRDERPAGGPGATEAADTATKAPAALPLRRRRLLKVGAAVLAAALLLGWAATRGGAPVGHFTSAEGHDAFVAAYERAMADLPEPDEVLDLRTDYGVVRMYRFEGAAPEEAPLVLLPGRASASPVFADNLASLLEVRTVYLIDLLGEPGASVQSRPIRDDEDQALWLHQALSQLPEPQVQLFGLSIGGWTAMNLAVRHPQTLAGLILLDPAVTFADLPPEVVVRSLPAAVPWFPKSWRDSFNQWTAGGAPVEDVPVADMIEAGMRHYSLALPAPTRFTDDRLTGVDLPVLVILAGESVMHDSAEAARTAERTLARGTVVTYPDASHAVNGEYPEEVAADVARFVDASP